MDPKRRAHARKLRRIAGAIARGLAAAEARAVARGDATPARGSPLARLAHELRTPLSAIVAAAEVMRDERLGPVGDARYLAYAGDIVTSARHALDVLTKTMDAVAAATEAARAAAGPDGPASAVAVDLPRLEPVRVDPSDLVHTLASSVRALLDTAGVETRLDLATDVPAIVVDTVTVRQMILNLVANAMRATPAGGSVTLSTAVDSAGAVVVAIADTGHGMDAATLARVRVGGGDAAAGRGLGLPLVARLADLNGARLDVTSAPGAGTVVTLTFAAGSDRRLAHGA